MDFKNVGELIDHLEKLGRDRLLIIDDDGNTWPLESESVSIWDEKHEDSPVAIFIGEYYAG